MIDINLVPEQLRKKKKAPVQKKEGAGGGQGVFVVVFIIVFLFLAGGHAFFQLIINKKFKEHKKLTGEWEQLSPQKDNTDSVVAEMKELREKVAAIESVAGVQDFSWASKLNTISDSLPRGVWLMRISLDSDVLIVQGSAVSKKKTEMINVHNFTSELKGNKNFMSQFSSLELGLMKTRKIQNTQIADFTITLDLLEEEVEE